MTIEVNIRTPLINGTVENTVAIIVDKIISIRSIPTGGAFILVSCGIEYGVDETMDEVMSLIEAQRTSAPGCDELVEAERERCAKVAEDYGEWFTQVGHIQSAARYIAHQIRQGA